MALNVAVPLSGLGELFEGCCLLSPISPIDMNFDSYRKSLVSPDSESSSGVSSLDSDETKKFQIPSHLRRSCSTPTTNGTDDNVSSLSPSPRSSPSSPVPQQQINNANHQTSQAEINLKNADDKFIEKQLSSPSAVSAAIAAATASQTSCEQQNSRKVEIIYQGRNIIDLQSNLQTNSPKWQFQYAHLPNNNLTMFLANRSQYHRLGGNGLIHEYTMAACNECFLMYPNVNNGPLPSVQPMTRASLSSTPNMMQQQQQQQQQHQLLQQQQQQMQQLQQQQQQQQLLHQQRPQSYSPPQTNGGARAILSASSKMNFLQSSTQQQQQQMNSTGAQQIQQHHHQQQQQQNRHHSPPTHQNYHRYNNYNNNFMPNRNVYNNNNNNNHNNSSYTNNFNNNANNNNNNNNNTFETFMKFQNMHNTNNNVAATTAAASVNNNIMNNFKMYKHF